MKKKSSKAMRASTQKPGTSTEKEQMELPLENQGGPSDNPEFDEGDFEDEAAAEYEEEFLDDDPIDGAI